MWRLLLYTSTLGELPSGGASRHYVTASGAALEGGGEEQGVNGGEWGRQISGRNRLALPYHNVDRVFCQLLDIVRSFRSFGKGETSKPTLEHG